MDWVTLTKEQVETDCAPLVCMECGSPATCRVNKTFSHTPDWVQYLYLAGVLPGIIADAYAQKQMRVACPFCEAHKNHWLKLVLVASFGWVAIFVFAVAGYVTGSIAAPGWPAAPYVGAGIGGFVGLIGWMIPLIRIGTTRIKVTNIAKDEITFERVAHAFAAAAKESGKGPH